jgi:hypothetical protein
MAISHQPPLAEISAMTELTRRKLLQLLAGSGTVAGAVILARTVLAEEPETPAAAPADPEERAGRVACELPSPPDGVEQASFLNRGFRNVRPGGAFRNGGFRNMVPGGGFRNGGFRNVPGPGGWRNGAFRNW